MNAKALRQAVKRAEREIEAYNVFDMGVWARRLFTSDKKRMLDEPCGTACCLAGFSLPQRRVQALLKRGQRTQIEWEAAEVLEINPEHHARLFSVAGWPLQFSRAYDEAERAASLFRYCTKKRLKAERAKVAVLKARVEHFIATGGWE
jgi:hypothetical protein